MELQRTKQRDSEVPVEIREGLLGNRPLAWRRLSLLLTSAMQTILLQSGWRAPYSDRRVVVAKS